ncbi:MAG: bifunctional phosphoribosylaminoimidazolecarboxamide formyltransferase/IMP cyclohydrolase [Gloeomargarita sp. SKYG116]|nr:bifunctional phosphoribosylaminoimidazolecarboxamide formyltransferase/IMP cyclohydrolase [Gloeomargarita sp. SKYG116]MDW8400299.1 bifunctional phosphoribosylaminoimidazolecarboxamide formyltransferase/IMP cyclohydrolase [Gloeomargarita sp. SKYGB_i_bin116]
MTRKALLSVSDKTGLVELAQALVQEFDYELLSSGGTARTLRAAGLPVTEVAEYTGSPEILGGRVKTLHPKIHGGILARRDVAQDVADLQRLAIAPIDLVVVNLYPFTQTIQQPDTTLADAVEQIDIGGPTLLRAAAKNHAFVTVLCNPQQYPEFLAHLRAHQGQTTQAFRQACAAQAFWHTSQYDQQIAAYLTEPAEPWPPYWACYGTLVQPLRYGENPHQQAAWYRTGNEPTGWCKAQQLQGKELSFNNLVDLEAARRLIAEFPLEQPTAVIIKHANPCGVACADDLLTAYQRAVQADPVSAFGGIVAVNQPLDAATAQAMTELFLECIVAPGCTDDARAILQRKSKVRVLVLPQMREMPLAEVRMISGGFLVQTPDVAPVQPQQWQVVTQRAPTQTEWLDLVFAWRVVKGVKSNAIVVAKQGVTLGIGAGQTNRVGSVRLALAQAGEQAQGAVLASDGFFPFGDSVQAAAAAGITAIVQPGGSLRDTESIQAADAAGVAMVFTGVRHFYH